MRKFNVNVNGKIYVVEIEETGEAAPVVEAPVEAVAEAPVSEDATVSEWEDGNVLPFFCYGIKRRKIYGR